MDRQWSMRALFNGSVTMKNKHRWRFIYHNGLYRWTRVDNIAPGSIDVTDLSDDELKIFREQFPIVEPIRPRGRYSRG